MKRVIALLLSLLLLLCACGKAVPAQTAAPVTAAPAPTEEARSASETAAPSPTADTAQPKPEPTPEPTPESTPEPTAEPTPMPTPEAYPEGPEIIAHEGLRLLCDRVPGIDRYLNEGILRTTEYSLGKTAIVYEDECEIIDLFDQQETDILRRFAWSPESGQLYEYDFTRDLWYYQGMQRKQDTLEDVREMLHDWNYIAGYAYVGDTPFKADDPDDIYSPIRYGDERIVSPAAKQIYPFLEEAEENRLVRCGEGDYLLIVPADPGASMAVNRMAEGEVQEVLYRSESGEPILLSLDTEAGEVQVVIVDPSGRAISFFPYYDWSFFDEDTGEYAVNVGDFEYLPMRGEVRGIYEVLLTYFPEREDSTAAWDILVLPETVTVRGRSCWLADIGVWFSESFQPAAQYAVSDDYRHVYQQRDYTEDGWQEVFGSRLLRAEYAEEVYDLPEDAVCWNAGDSEYAVKVAFSSDFHLRFLSLESLTLVDQDIGSGDGSDGPYFSLETVCTLDELWAGEYLTAAVDFPGDLPAWGISLTDPDGHVHFFVLDVSGEDGSLYLIEY